MNLNVNCVDGKKYRLTLLALGQLKAHAAIAITHLLSIKDGHKTTRPHAKRKHAPIVFLNFVTRIGCWSKTLYSDVVGEFISRVFKPMFLARVCNHIIVPEGEHHVIGKTESDVAELDKMTRTTIHEAYLPFNVWDFVVCHDTPRFYDHVCHR